MDMVECLGTYWLALLLGDDPLVVHITLVAEDHFVHILGGMLQHTPKKKSKFTQGKKNQKQQQQQHTLQVDESKCFQNPMFWKVISFVRPEHVGYMYM